MVCKHKANTRLLGPYWVPITLGWSIGIPPPHQFQLFSHSIIAKNPARGHRTGSNSSGMEEYDPRKKKENKHNNTLLLVHHITEAHRYISDKKNKAQSAYVYTKYVRTVRTYVSGGGQSGKVSKKSWSRIHEVCTSSIFTTHSSDLTPSSSFSCMIRGGRPRERPAM